MAVSGVGQSGPIDRPDTACITFTDLAGSVKTALGDDGDGCDIYTNRDLEADLKAGVRGIFEKRYRRAYFLVRDLRYQGRLIRYKTLLTLSGAREKKIIDLQGRAIDVTLPRLALVDVPHAALDYLFSYAVVLYTSLLMRYYAMTGKERTLPGDLKKVAYLRTDHMFDVRAGGSVGHVAGVANGLHGLGYGVFFISTDRLMLIDESKTPVYVVKPSYAFFNAMVELPEIVYNFKFIRAARRIFARERPDVIYQRYSRNNFAGIALARRYRIPLVIEYNGSFLWMGKNWEDSRAFLGTMEAIELANLRLADLVVVVSEVMKRELLGRGLPGSKILVNPNCVDPDVYRPSIDGSAVRKKFGLEGKVVVGFIGTFGPWHGTDVLAAAVKEVVRAGPRVHFLLIGDGFMMQKTRGIIEKDGMGPAVTFTGLVPQADAPEYLAACDILVNPTVPNPDGTPFFGSPTKLFEYMAMGRAIVASDLDQIGEVLEHERTALLVKPGDADRLGDAIVRLAGDAALRERLGKNAREEAIRSFTWKSNARKVMEALKGERPGGG